jgi:hypothetical protein
MLDPTKSDPRADQLNDEAVAVLDTCRRANFKLQDLVLPDGRNLQDYLKATEPGALHRNTATTFTYNDRKSYVIALMTYQAWWLTQDRTYPAGTGINEPEQTSGLGYVLGGKQTQTRQSALDLNTGTCDDKIYGIDCSGLISNIAYFAHLVNPPAGTSNQQIPANWEKVLKNSYSEFANVKVERVENLPNSKLIPGDIVFFRPKEGSAINHVGIILQDNKGNLALINSYGNGSAKCTENYNYIRLGVKKGPTQISLTGRGKNIDNFLGKAAQRATTLRIVDDPGFFIVSGDNQVAKMGAVLPTPLKVRVIGSDGQPQSGTKIIFKETEVVGFPNIYTTYPNSGTKATFNPATAITDADGYATTIVTLPCCYWYGFTAANPVPSVAIIASVPDQNDLPSLKFSVTTTL